MQHPQRFLLLVQEALKTVPEVNIETVKQKLTDNEDFLLIDVREESEWEKGQLPKAIHVSKGILESRIEKVCPELDKEIVLYCGGGYRSALAAEALQKMGYKNVFSMAGGFRGWMDSN